MSNIFPQYFVLDKLLKGHKSTVNLHDFYIIGVQHLMRSTGSLFETLIHWGIEPTHIFLTGKIYSAHQETIEKLSQLGINIKAPTIPDCLGYYSDFLEKDIQHLWDELKKALTQNAKIIILDDGGYALKSVPDEILENFSVFGIEQTTSGVRLQKAFKAFPVINVATSKAKTIIEPPIVSEAVKIQLGEVINKLKPKSIGIIGFGHIGKAIAEEFSNHYNINVFDHHINKSYNQKHEQFSFCNSKDELVYESDIIIGATGADISDVQWLMDLNGDKTFISVSSGDIEFNTIIRNSLPFFSDKFNSPLQDLNLITSNGKKIKILRGGMVANFTGKADSSPGHIIQMTRGLLFSAIIQIIDNYIYYSTKTGLIELSTNLQKEVVSFWFIDQPKRKDDFKKEIIEMFKN